MKEGKGEHLSGGIRILLQQLFPPLSHALNAILVATIAEKTLLENSNDIKPSLSS